MPLGWVRSPWQSVARWPDQEPVPLGPDVALLCHYDPGGTVRPDLLSYLAALREAGFTVAVISNSAYLRPDAWVVLRRCCAAVLLRRNVGWDFSAWREAMAWLGLPRPETRRLLLVNDSVYGPLTPLAPLLARMDDGADLWGMTDSRERGWHLQSYFLLAQGPVLRDAAWRRFWARVRPLPSKHAAIGRYEVGFSQHLAASGWRVRALFPWGELGCVAGQNPTLAAWRVLLDAGFPFLKRELVRDNPLRDASVAGWPSFVDDRWAAAIGRDLARGDIGARGGCLHR
jgi:lipopolysaccharide biosynthesis protein